jgi:hypothetical protein
VTPTDPSSRDVAREHHQKLGRVEARLGSLEEKGRPDQATAAAERGWPADWMTAEQNVWKRLSPFHGKWPKVTEVEGQRPEKPLQGVRQRSEQALLPSEQRGRHSADHEVPKGGADLNFPLLPRGERARLARVELVTEATRDVSPPGRHRTR